MNGSFENRPCSLLTHSFHVSDINISLFMSFKNIHFFKNHVLVGIMQNIYLC